MKCISKNIKPLEVGDYVYCEVDFKDIIIENFLSNNPAKVTNIFFNTSEYINYIYVTFNKPLPKHYRTIDKKLRFFLSQIKVYSDKKDDIELYISSKKYNL